MCRFIVDAWRVLGLLFLLGSTAVRGHELRRLPAAQTAAPSDQVLVFAYDADEEAYAVDLLTSPIGTSLFEGSSVWQTASVTDADTVPADARSSLLSVAHLQDEAESDESLGNASEGNASEGKASEGYQKETLGQRPEDRSRFFLRRATPLLAPGQVSFDYGFRYTWREFIGLSLLPDGSLTTGRVRTRQMTSPLAIRYGLNRRSQLFASMPLGVSILDRADLARQEVTSVFGPGDFSFGINYLLRQASGNCPDVVGGLTVTAPVGADPFEFSPGPAAQGSGFWGFSGNLFYVRQTDPAVLFGGFGATYQLDRSYLGAELDPGISAFYQLGAGFAVNQEITFTTTFQGSYQSKLAINGNSIPNSAQEPMTFRAAVVLSHCKHVIFEPFISLGVTPDAPDADFGVVITRM